MSRPSRLPGQLLGALSAALALVVVAALSPPLAWAAPTPGASATPTAIAEGGESEVTLTFDGESTTTSTPTDLVIVMDESGSISSSEFRQLKTFTDQLIRAVGSDGLFANGGRVGLVGFASTAELISPLESNPGAVLALNQANVQSRGSTCIGCGLDVAGTVLGPDDPDRNQLVVVITDGVPNSIDRTSTAAAALHTKATVFAVGIGSVNQTTLNTIASGPGTANTFLIAGFDDLSGLLESLVASVSAPASTNPEISVALAEEWSLEPGSVTANLGATVSGITSTGFSVSRGSLGAGEQLAISYTVVHEGPACDELSVNDAVTYTDDEGSTVAVPDVKVTVTCPRPPTADAGDDVTVDEGSSVALVGSGTDPDGTIEGYAWTGADPAVGTLTDADRATATYTGVDDGTDEVTLTVTDDDGLTGDDTATVTVRNVAPSLDLDPCPTAATTVGDAVTLTGSFTDPGTADTHTVGVDWGDGSTTSPTATTSDVSVGHTYTAAGLYEVEVTVTDDDGGSDTATCAEVVVVDPSAGYVTGGGWIPILPSADSPDPTGKGQVSVGARYQAGATSPVGETQFNSKDGRIKLHSEGLDWLVVTGDTATYQGSARVNGTAGFTFRAVVTDGSPDSVALRVTRDSDGVVVHDTPMTTLGGGQLTIHR